MILTNHVLIKSSVKQENVSDVNLTNNVQLDKLAIIINVTTVSQEPKPVMTAPNNVLKKLEITTVNATNVLQINTVVMKLENPFA